VCLVGKVRFSIVWSQTAKKAADVAERGFNWP